MSHLLKTNRIATADGPGRAMEGTSASAIAKRMVRWGMSLFPDEFYLALSHRRRIGRFPRIKNPATFNELMLARCLRPDPRWKDLSDKLNVRAYVRNRIGEKYLIPLIAAPDVFTRAIFDLLPSSFVMKASHGSGFVEVVWDKSRTSFDALQRRANEWLGIDYYRIGRERHYRGIRPRIFFEKLLLDSAGKVPADLKMHVFGRGPDGPVIYTGVIADRFGDARADIYDAHWNRLDLAWGSYARSKCASPRPSNWEELTNIAMRLADGLGYVRVDLYAPDDQVYFGELTFTPGGGTMPYTPDRCDYEWGRILKEATYTPPES
ncbi:ATP-grasp fold amidoligase family protein [Trinickia dabaoshanensis]|nr:ATP-grasp fold amidoligase family protein [Trinickia dabaoshanensis]